nr:hypothetical protein [Evansella caseinilytica]
MNKHEATSNTSQTSYELSHRANARDGTWIFIAEAMLAEEETMREADAFFSCRL